MHDLSTLGFGPFFEKQLPAAAMIPARIAAEHRGGYDVWSSVGEGFARLAGRLARDLEGAAFPGVGDWVALKSPPGPGQTATIHGVLPRRTLFVRGAAGRQTRAQVIAANVDIVFVVCGLDGDCNVRRIERYLARIWAGGAQPMVILNKADLCDDVDARVAEVKHACLEVPVLVVSALLSAGIDEIRDHLGIGVTAAFVGSSGAGKSTVINALLGEQRMATAATRARDGRGCHTTTNRQLILFPGAGLLIDTPGMRELQLLDGEGIGAVFADIGDLSAQCRFKDCSHQSEPGCAVRDQVAAGGLRRDRLEHYLKMEAEAQSCQARQDKRHRRKADRVVSKRYTRDGKLIRRLKEGE